MPDELNNITTLPSSNMTPVVTAIPGSSQNIDNANITPGTPSFQVPSNPLLPPGYQETLDYSSLQYVNGFYRTQIGKYVRIDQILGSNNITQQEGFLIGVGYNYILLQEGYTQNIMVIDIYSVKNMYVYYHDRIPAYTGMMNTNEETDI